MFAFSWQTAAINPSWLLMVIGLTCIGMSGCGANDSATPTAGPEHEVPAHRPPDYPTAVTELESRLAEFAVAADSKDSSLDVQTTDAVDARRDELRDIVRWLPEIAGDSDLRKAHWEQARDCAASLLRVIEPALAGHRSFSPTEQEQLAGLLTELKTLATFAVKKVNGVP